MLSDEERLFWEDLASAPEDPAALARIRAGLEDAARRWRMMLAARGWEGLSEDEVDERLENERLERDWMRGY